MNISYQGESKTEEWNNT